MGEKKCGKFRGDDGNECAGVLKNVPSASRDDETANHFEESLSDNFLCLSD